MRSLSLLVVLVMLSASACRTDFQSKGTEVPARPIEAVLHDHTNALMSVPGVVGVFQGETDEGKPCIGVMVVKRTPEIESKVPDHLEGYPVEIQVTGEIRPLDG